MILGMTMMSYNTKVMIHEKIIDTLDFLKFKKISSVTDNVRRISRLIIDWETTFAKGTSDKGWLSKIYTKILKTQQ